MKYTAILISLIIISYPFGLFSAELGRSLLPCSSINCPERRFSEETGVLFLKKVNGELIWSEEGNEKIHWKYKGEIKNGKPDGTGILNSPFGEYIGELKNGKLHGQGTYTYKSGRTRIGEFKMGKPWNVKNFNKEGIILEEWVNGEKIRREKIDPVLDKELSDFRKNIRFRILLGKTLSEPITSNYSLSLMWKNYGFGLNQMFYKATSSKKVLYEMNNSSIDFSYTLFVSDIREYTLTSGVGYIFDGKGEITVESTDANYVTKDVVGYSFFGSFGMQWYGVEAILGVRYSKVDYKQFKGTNTNEVVNLEIPYYIVDKPYTINGSTFLLGIGYNF